MHLHYSSSFKEEKELEQNVFHSEIKWKIYLFFHVLIWEKIQSWYKWHTHVWAYSVGKQPHQYVPSGW